MERRTLGIELKSAADNAAFEADRLYGSSRPSSEDERTSVDTDETVLNGETGSLSGTRGELSDETDLPSETDGHTSSETVVETQHRTDNAPREATPAQGEQTSREADENAEDRTGVNVERQEKLREKSAAGDGKAKDVREDEDRKQGDRKEGVGGPKAVEAAPDKDPDKAVEAAPDKDPDKVGVGKISLSRYQAATLVLTYLAYVSYHMSRKPLSVVKNSLHKNCTGIDVAHHLPNDTTWCDWKPFDGDNYEHLFGWLDVGFLGTYAAFMFVSGYVAERMNLRLFLTIGMVMSGAFTALFGVGYFLNIHNFYYYLVIQMLAGAFQSTGWPAVVATVGNWFGPGRRGAIMGLWNSHTSVGNILGALIPGVWADGEWGWSFIVPGIIIGGLGLIICCFLVPYPKDVGIEVNNSREEAPKGVQGSTNNPADDTPLLASLGENHAAVSLAKALRLPGVVEFSLCLFFAKLVSYTFLFWLPKYIGSTTDFSAQKSADLSTLFDVGGVVGGVIAGAVTDRNRSPGINCVVLLVLGTPVLFIYQAFGSESYANSIGLLLVCGALVNGPYALITTAVSADLGTQKALRGNKKALATVTSIIDGTGSIGAALGPLLTGWISPTGWQNVFYMLIAANICAALLLVRIVVKEIRSILGYNVLDDDVEDISHLSREVYPDYAGIPRPAYRQRVEDADNF